MAIEFERLWALLLLPPLLYVTWHTFRRSPWGRHWPLLRRRVTLGLRMVLIVLLVLALSGVRWQTRVDEQAVVFVVDRSASARTVQTAADDWLLAAQAAKQDRDQVGIVVTGTEAQVDRPVSAAPAAAPRTRPNHSFTNIQSGLRLAAGLLADGHERRIVVLSDGRENAGDALAEARWLASQGIRIDVVPLVPTAGEEVLVQALRVPPTLYEGEVFDLAVEIQSSTTTSGRLRLYRDRAVLGEQDVQLQPGLNRIVFAAVASGTGYHAYRVEIEATHDTLGENNSASAVSLVRGQPQVLLVTDKPDDAAPLATVLAAGDINVRVAPPNEVPSAPVELAGYSAVWLVDVPATSLGEDAMEGLKRYVRDLGGGLVMTGGPDSYGLGGYFRSPVEDALPVHMDLRGRANLPSLGLTLVLDKSGSMMDTARGPTKMELAKEAAARSTDALTAQDWVSVIAFDSAAGYVVQPEQATNIDSVKDRIGGIYAEGGTDVYAGLALGVEAAKQMPTQLRHIILLTDGQSSTRMSYEALLVDAAEHNITVTTVAVGSDADTILLEWLAGLGNGRYYYTDDPATIPSILTKETMMAARSFIVEETFVPAIVSHSSVLRGLLDGVPALDGYVATSAKPTAEVVLVSPEGDPVLAQWQYGLGRAMAWTPDAAGRWTSGWLAGGTFDTAMTNMLAWVLPQRETGSLHVTTSSEGGTGRVAVDVPVGESAPQPRTVTVIGPDGEQMEVPIRASAPGQYTAEFPTLEPGVYLTQVVATTPGGDGGEEPSLQQTTTALVVPYSPEFRETGVDEAWLAQLAAAGGGEVLSDPAAAFARNLPRAYDGRDLWPWLLALAIVLFPLDIAARRFSWSEATLRRVWAVVAGPLRRLRRERTWRAVVSADGDGGLGRLVSHRQAVQRTLQRDVAGAPKDVPVDAAGPAKRAVGAPPPPDTPPRKKENAPGANSKQAPPAAEPSREGSFTSELLARRRKR